MSEEQTERIKTFIDVDELNSLSQLRESSEQNTVTDCENVTPESTTTSNILVPTPRDDLNPPASISVSEVHKKTGAELMSNGIVGRIWKRNKRCCPHANSAPQYHWI